MPSLSTCQHAEHDGSIDAKIAAQHRVIAELEASLWKSSAATSGYQDDQLAAYQTAWRHLEALLAQQEAVCGQTTRHHFLIIIPVADSPIHLKDCLNSLLQLCRAYGYGGQESEQHSRWRKVSVLLADDSSQARAIAQNRAIAAEFDGAGLTVHYFGLEQQQALLARLAGIDLTAIVGQHAQADFGHKGQAMMRNIAYLQCAVMQQAQPEEKWLFYTIDADQEFKVKVPTSEGGAEVYAVNFLYHLDAIFNQTDAQILTGKVVGDPPVSPAVMAANFLHDVIGFLTEMTGVAADAAYAREGNTASHTAAYHDMADLFGFAPAADAAFYRYHCPLAAVSTAVVGTAAAESTAAPSNAACFADFARRLHRFFHGEHPTRITWFEPADVMRSVQPARTVYTGNYVFRPQALKWFIPYAPLRLRMSGPSMGRLLQAEVGAQFVSANLPMLHKRTLAESGQSEFRPGVVDEGVRQIIDLCGEFERQFHGDVMLFSLQRLTALGYPSQTLKADQVAATLLAMQGEMREKYQLKQQLILQRLAQVKALLTVLLHATDHGWNQTPELMAAHADFQIFINNIEHNFAVSSPCYARIDAADRREDWRNRQLAAIIGLQANQQAWSVALNHLAYQ